MAMRISLTLPLLLAVARADGTQEYSLAGLRNQGNTCYMNSLLQSLHHLPDFRRLLYLIKTSAGDEPGTSIPLEMQRVCYQLQHGPAHGLRKVETELLTSSFGWGWREVNEQQDVQEFWHMLHEALLSASASSGPVDGVHLRQLFEGRVLNYVRCTRVSFRSEREEKFCDLQMQVSGCNSLLESFGDFVKEERLEGSNAYNTRNPKLGRQEAQRGAAFSRLPPVLQLHLKRFEYDQSTGEMRKLQQAFTFPKTLRLRKFMTRDVSGAQPVYRLHAVLSHAGNARGGHYVAYVRARSGNKWFKFDDAQVTEVPEAAAVTEQFGGEYSRPTSSVFGSGEPPTAYMLTYVRQAEDRAATEPTGEELPPDVRRLFDQQLSLRRRPLARLPRSAARGSLAAASQWPGSSENLACDDDVLADLDLSKLF